MPKLKYPLLAFMLFLVSCDSQEGNSIVAPSSSSSNQNVAAIDYTLGHAMNARLGRGINLGNALDAECGASTGWDECWNNPIKPEYFTIIKKAGFQSVRIPVRWSEKASDEAPFTINPEFTARVREVVTQANAAGLVAIINIHHYDELYNDDKSRTDLELQKLKFLFLWQQIAASFADFPNETLAFELLNEGRNQVSAQLLNGLITQVWPLIRATNPGRTIIVNPANWGAFSEITTLELPADGNVIASGHFYDPHEFTHQGMGIYPQGVSWGTKSDVQDLLLGFESAYQQAQVKWVGTDGGTIPLNIGEFGANDNGQLADRALYTKTIREECELHSMSWHYWGFTGVQFDAYVRSTGAWIPEILAALIPSGT